MFPCPSCAKWVRVDDNGRMPPWCKACGASLKADAPRPTPPVESYTPARVAIPETSIQRAGTVVPRTCASPSTDIQSAETRRPVAPSISTDIQEGRPLPAPPRPVLPAAAADVPDISIGANQRFWNAQPVSIANSRAGRYRVYLTRTELFFILMDPDKTSTQAFEAAGYVLGGLVGGLLTEMALEESAPRRTSSIAEVLRGADEETLRLYAQREPGCFYRVLDHCARVRIDPPSTWVRWIKGIEHEAQLTLTHNGVDETWALPNYHDARKAAQGLTDAMDARLEIGIDWGRSFT